MLQQIEEVAEICVARACGFAALAILTLILGLSWNMTLASKIGGLLMLAACLVLILKARNAVTRPVQRTELWMTLDPRWRPAPAFAQRMLGETLRVCYFRFALQASFLSAALLSISLVLSLRIP